MVRAVNGSGTLLGETLTTDTGEYALTVSPNSDVRIQVVARSFDDAGASDWDFSVTDNTQGDAVYVLSGALATSGTVDSTRSINAQSGWTGSSYGDTRAAAPFAILDKIVSAVRAVEAVDSDVAFPPLESR